MPDSPEWWGIKIATKSRVWGSVAQGPVACLPRYNGVMALFDSLGFRWDRDSVPRELPRASLSRVVFRFSRMLPEYVWDAGVLEGNPFTFPEVKTLLGRRHCGRP
jgi:hypothetical protein